jgi:deoxyadenosine/deoxycytidine kinase
LVFLLWEVKMSFLEDLEGRGRPVVVLLGAVESKLERLEEKAREVEEEISFGVFFGLRMP